MVACTIILKIKICNKNKHVFNSAKPIQGFSGYSIESQTSEMIIFCVVSGIGIVRKGSVNSRSKYHKKRRYKL